MTDITEAFRAAVRGVRERAKLPLTAQSDVLKPLRRTAFRGGAAALAAETA